MGGNGGCLKGVALPDDSQMPCGLSEIGTKSRLAVRPITLVAAALNVPPTTPPTSARERRSQPRQFAVSIAVHSW